MVNKAVIIYSEEYEKINISLNEIHVEYRFLVREEFVPKYNINNTTYSGKNEINTNAFFSCYNEIRQIIDEHSINTIIFLMPNDSLKQVCEMFRELANIEAYILPINYTNNSISSFCDLIKIDLDKPRLRFVQYNVAQNCNLNCKGCANYSNIYRNTNFNCAESFRNDLIELKKFFWGVQEIKLMGGEPLLNDNICSFLIYAREIFPDSKLTIGTNGILLNKMDSKFFDVVKRNSVTFAISLYPSLKHKKESLEILLNKYDIDYIIMEFKGEFMKYLYDYPVRTMEDGYNNCPAKECHCLDNGYLAVCSKPLYLYRLNDNFNLNIPDQSGKFNLYKTNIDPWKLDELLRTPFDTCRYCGEKQYFAWKTVSKDEMQIQDWICN